MVAASLDYNYDVGIQYFSRGCSTKKLYEYKASYIFSIHNINSILCSTVYVEVCTQVNPSTRGKQTRQKNPYSYD